MIAGAGVVGVLKPGKRLRNWHRRDRSSGGMTSLKTYARSVARQPGSPEEVAVARTWIDSVKRSVRK